MVTTKEVQEEVNRVMEEAMFKKKAKKMIQEKEREMGNSELYAFLGIEEVKA